MNCRGSTGADFTENRATNCLSVLNIHRKGIYLCAFACCLVLPVFAEQEISLIPWPKSVQADGGQLVITEKTRIVTADKRLAPLAAILSEGIWRLTAQRLGVAEGKVGAGVMGLRTPDWAEQINRSMFAGLLPFGHIEVRLHGLHNARTLELNGQLRIPAGGDYEFKVRATIGRAELASGKAVIGACLEPSGERITRGKLKAGVYPFTIKYYNQGVFNDLNIQVKGPGLNDVFVHYYA